MPGVHRKSRGGPEASRFFATEAAGLAWILVADGPFVPEVVALSATGIAIRWVAQAPPTTGAALDLGRRLAVLHDAGAPAFGSPPPTAPGPDGWIGDLPMQYAADPTFPQFWALRRLAPTARRARDRGGLGRAEAAIVDRFCADLVDGQVDTGPAEPPARLHGDLWNGNVIWGAEGQAWLIDPAAHGGHRESDLAMLALFGAPHLDLIIAGYQEVHPLPAGWRQRVALHQAWPLLVHAALFGGGYARQAIGTIQRARG